VPEADSNAPEADASASLAEQEQARLNTEVYAHGNFVRVYASTDLREVETVILGRYREDLSGATLELGCGAGRLTGHLGELSDAVHGIDLSPNMVAYCRKRYPQIEFSEGDLRDLSQFQDASFKAVLAPFNVLDVLGDRDRDRVLDEIHRVLVDSGLLVMSSHNQGAAALVTPPRPKLKGNPLRVLASMVYFVPRWVNRRRLAHLEHTDADYAILNDSAHNYSLLHYYTSRDGQERKLAARGFELLECLDLDGAPVQSGESAAHCTELHYVARRHQLA
jgi:ubiquinone/menaquinone biosynthesis C-methylase UbiE